MSDYKSILADHGYLQIKGCSCGGVRNDKYQKGQYIVYIRVTRLTFRIKRGGQYLTASTPIKELNEALAAQEVGI